MQVSSAGRIEQMAEALPALARPLRRLVERLVDLPPVVRNHVYHPDFRGSFGLKSVLSALVPELRYDDLAIADGATATLDLERLLFSADDLTMEARERMRHALLRYCYRDTWGLVAVLTRLSQLAGRVSDHSA